MSLDSHIQAIADKRQHLKQQISDESLRPSPDFALITQLKKQNLMLKEEMQACFKMQRSAAGNA